MKQTTSDAFILVLAGIISKNLGNWDQSLAYMEGAVLIAPEWFYPRMWAAQVAYTSQNYPKASQHLQQLIDLHRAQCKPCVPDKFLASKYAMLGYSMSRLGELELAKQSYRMALDANPSDAEIRRRYEGSLWGNSG